ncbi:MAG: peroxiredoxin [Chloroflexi bacterium]|nr:peroxiredoxin [Chloroflexota bacterium]
MGDSTKTLKVGDAAPDFELKGTENSEFKLSDAKGKHNVVLNFFPAAFSGVCSQQMPRIQDQKSMFDDDTLVFGVSVDNNYTLDAWAKQMGIEFPLLSDFWPHGAVAEKFGVLFPVGVAERAVIGIDKEGIIRYIDVHPVLEVPDLDECAVALKG